MLRGPIRRAHVSASLRFGRDARAMRIYGGTSEAQQATLAAKALGV